MHIFTHVTINAGLAAHIYVCNKFLCLTNRYSAPPPLPTNYIINNINKLLHAYAGNICHPEPNIFPIPETLQRTSGVHQCTAFGTTAGHPQFHL